MFSILIAIFLCKKPVGYPRASTSGSGGLQAVWFEKVRARVPSGLPKSASGGSGFRAQATLTQHYYLRYGTRTTYLKLLTSHAINEKIDGRIDNHEKSRNTVPLVEFQS